MIGRDAARRSRELMADFKHARCAGESSAEPKGTAREALCPVF
jgi:hypothetical protein